MKDEQEYTFVTIDDSDFNDVSDGFIVDIDLDGESLSLDAITVDEDHYESDLITLSDDTVFMTDADVIDMSSTDLDDADVSFIL